MECKPWASLSKASKQTAYQDLINKLVKHHIETTCTVFYLLAMHVLSFSYVYNLFALL